MGKMAMTLITVLFLSVVTAFNDMKFDYQIIEGKARYLENIETNLEKNIVKIHTPAHNDVMESYQIQDFIQGKQLICLPSINQCRLRDIDRDSAIDSGKVTESFIHSWNKGDNTITSESSVVVTELYYPDFNDVLDDNSLGKALNEFYQHFKYPLYREWKVPKDAEVYNMTHSPQRLVKRDAGVLNHDCNGQAIKTVYGIDSGTHCNHYIMCDSLTRNGRVILDDNCGNIHITSPLVYQCVCCHWVTAIDDEDCACVKKNV
ncbi:uncharacterized protein LOC143048969 [Mytilus galloprovincialis]|uniref:uncharacterized protein LOC143048969 n=1 Tax=Mytilus galloprovincialis TaxID=29158 RepID=UPI003F7BA159